MIIPFFTNKVKVTSTYGERVLNGERQFHSGYDLVGVGSYDVTAAVGGKVIRSQIITDKNNLTWQWGNYVCIYTNDGQYHYYCHLASRSVSEGNIVNSGDKIGVMGNTGYSFGSHLHFEVRDAGGKTINPCDVLDIPNKTGEYEMTEEITFEQALEILKVNGITNSPEYWRENAYKVKYLPELLINVAKAIR